MTDSARAPVPQEIEVQQYSGFGLQTVYLTRNCLESETTDGRTTTTLTGPRELNRGIALAFAYKPKRISGPELKAIRKNLGIKGKLLAEWLSMTPSHLSKVESGAKGLGACAEKLVRFHLQSELSRTGLLGVENYTKANPYFEQLIPPDDGSVRLLVTNWEGMVKSIRFSFEIEKPDLGQTEL